MRIEVLYFSGCPGYERVLPVLRALAAEAGGAEGIELRAVETLDDAARRRFLGSPTIRVDGEDIEPGAGERTDFGLKCRLYRSGDDASGQPPEELIRTALGRRRRATAAGFGDGEQRAHRHQAGQPSEAGACRRRDAS